MSPVSIDISLINDAVGRWLRQIFKRHKKPRHMFGTYRDIFHEAAPGRWKSAGQDNNCGERFAVQLPRAPSSSAALISHGLKTEQTSKAIVCS